MTDTPLLFRWSGDTMEPLGRHHERCNELFVVGEIYRMNAVEERSLASHNHFFAALHDAWLNLPDEKAMGFPTAEALRKHALIMTGHRDERKFSASSPAEARKIAAFLKPRDEYAIISFAGNVVLEWTAKSQSRKAMGGPTFQKSKDDVLDFVAGLIDVPRETLSAEAGRAA